MAYTLEQVAALEAAIAEGALTVKYADKQVTYRSLDEMLRILGIMRGDLGLDGDTGAGRGGIVYPNFSKGLRVP